MSENVIIVNCKVPSEAYRILSMLWQDINNDNFAISQAAVVKKDGGKLSLEDAFMVDDPAENLSQTGGLIGSLVGILGGSMGVLLGSSIGSLIGRSMDEMASEDKTTLLEKAGEFLMDGQTALLLMAEEEDESALPAKLKDFQISLTRMDAAAVASEIEYAKNQELPKEEDGNSAAYF